MTVASSHSFCAISAIRRKFSCPFARHRPSNQIVRSSVGSLESRDHGALESPAYRASDTTLRTRVAEQLNRAHADAVAGQSAAAAVAGDRHSRLRTIAVPTMVIHGDADALFPVEANVDRRRRHRRSRASQGRNGGRLPPGSSLPRSHVSGSCFQSESAIGARRACLSNRSSRRGFDSRPSRHLEPAGAFERRQ